MTKLRDMIQYDVAVQQNMTFPDIHLRCSNKHPSQASKLLAKNGPFRYKSYLKKARSIKIGLILLRFDFSSNGWYQINTIYFLDSFNLNAF